VNKAFWLGKINSSKSLSTLGDYTWTLDAFTQRIINALTEETSYGLSLFTAKQCFDFASKQQLCFS